MQNLWSIAFFSFSGNGRRPFIHYISIYVSKMFSLLGVLGQAIPGGSESPFCAAGLRQRRAWNPITSVAMLALWHQTPLMQNATAGVHQRRAPHFSQRRGVHWWVARLSTEQGRWLWWHWWGTEWRKEKEWGEDDKVVVFYHMSCWWTSAVAGYPFDKIKDYSNSNSKQFICRPLKENLERCQTFDILCNYRISQWKTKLHMSESLCKSITLCWRYCKKI